MITRCDLCERLLTNSFGERLASANFDSRILKKHAENKEITWALCDECHAKATGVHMDDRQVISCQAERIRDLVSENNKLANQLRAALTQLAAKPVVHQPEAMASLKQRALEEEYKLALETLKQVWTYSNFGYTGFKEMTPEQQELFRVVTGHTPKEVAQ